MSKHASPLAAAALAVALLAAPLATVNAQGIGLANAEIQNASPSLAPAGDGSTFTANPHQIAAFLRNRGQATQVGTDNDGDPTVLTSSQGVRYTVYFYGCTNGQDCNSISFDSAFRPTKKSSLDHLNAWNTAKRHAYAVRRSDANIAIRMDVNMLGGMSEALFTQNVRLWDDQLGDFLRHIEY